MRRVHLGDVAQHARPQRDRIQRRAVAPQRRLALGGADQVAPDVAVELRPRRRDEFVQALVVAGRVRSGAALRASVSPPFGWRHQAQTRAVSARGSGRRPPPACRSMACRAASPASRRQTIATRARTRSSARPRNAAGAPNVSATHPATVVLSGGAEAGRQAERADRQVEIAGAPRQIGGDQRHHQAEHRRADAVQHLRSPPAARRPGRSTNSSPRSGSAAKPTSRIGRRPMRCARRPAQGEHSRDHDLRHDDRRRDHEPGVANALRQLIQGQRQHRGVGELEQHDADREDVQRSARGRCATGGARRCCLTRGCSSGRMVVSATTVAAAEHQQRRQRRDDQQQQ